MVLVLGIVKTSLKILGIGIGVKKVVLLMSDVQFQKCPKEIWATTISLFVVFARLRNSRCTVNFEF